MIVDRSPHLNPLPPKVGSSVFAAASRGGCLSVGRDHRFQTFQTAFTVPPLSLVVRIGLTAQATTARNCSCLPTR